MSEKKTYGVLLDYCPFCGSDDLRLYYENLDRTWNIKCSDCNGSLLNYGSMEDVVRLWNGDDLNEKTNEKE